MINSVLMCSYDSLIVRPIGKEWRYRDPGARSRTNGLLNVHDRVIRAVVVNAVRGKSWCTIKRESIIPYGILPSESHSSRNDRALPHP